MATLIHGWNGRHWFDGRTRIEALPNGYWRVRGMGSGLECLYDPQARTWRSTRYGFAIEAVLLAEADVLDVNKPAPSVDGCPACGFAYSFVFHTQFHAADCPTLAEATTYRVELSSSEYGTEAYDYDTEREALEGLDRLRRSAAEHQAKDGISRTVARDPTG